MPVPTPESLFATRLAADPGGPLVTFYDDATGERIELSAKNTGNWIAKTYSLLTDALGLGPGDTAFVRLPLHWLAVPILFGCWFAGVEVVSRPGADVAFADADSLAGIDRPAADEVFAVSLLSMARPGTPPPGADDYALAVRPMPDAWSGVQPRGGPYDLALEGVNRADLVLAAAAAVGSLGLAPGGRVLWSTEPDWVASVLAPVSVGGSTVLVRHADPATLAATCETERVTVRH
ncbi:MAG TPA: TIGR03089 family protein [Jatrophihabitans sp.]|nr:TIGR03089 family protein [Jatrophihabitans sp.]